MGNDISGTSDRAKAAFRLLRSRMTEAGLLHPTPWRYAACAAIAWLGLFSAGALLLFSNAYAVQGLAATLFGVALVQIGAIGHDADHGQLTHSPKLDNTLAWLHWNLGTGISHGWWHDKHTRHHRFTNVPDLDADFYPILTYSVIEAQNATGLKRRIAKHEHLYYPMLLSLTRGYFQLLSLAFIGSHSESRLRELLPIFVHHAAVITLHISAGGLGWGCFLLALGYATAGLYMGYIFSPNHIGMPLANTRDAGALAQLETTRDVRTSRAGDWVWAGLNYQVEHHLFPDMSRFHLRRAGGLVESWCDSEQLPYTRVPATRAWVDVLKALRHTGCELRKRDAGASP